MSDSCVTSPLLNTKAYLVNRNEPFKGLEGALNITVEGVSGYGVEGRRPTRMETIK